jgi:alkanesulfonate monooxygenase SsuD/methylene tetrahydromethanopterin reductase-like flavin-dependent oxidoreductase (luciferase family)
MMTPYEPQMMLELSRIMTTFFMNCAETTTEAVESARVPFNRHLSMLVETAAEWVAGASTKDYPGYDKMLAQLAGENFDRQREKNFAWVGTPDEITDMIRAYDAAVGLDIASFVVSPANTPVADAERSIRLFSEHVMPRFTSVAAAT